MNSAGETYATALRDAALAAAAVANVCDHLEHLEEADRAIVAESGVTFRRLAAEVAEASGVDIFDLYAQRLYEIEQRNLLATSADLDGAALARSAATWRDLQDVQVAHDRAYHPDVFGLSRFEQLRHYAFHLSKLVGALAEASATEGGRESFSGSKRLADMLLFGIKLATVVNVSLPSESLR